MDHWAHDWQSNVTRVAQSLGYRNLTDLLANLPSKPYSEIVTALNNEFAPAQIVSVQYKEAKEAETVRDAAKDALCRHVVKCLPEGWGYGDKSDWQAIRAISSWSSELQVTGECEELKPILDQLSNHLLKVSSPPKGWIPTGPNDPVISEAFDKYWPVE